MFQTMTKIAKTYGIDAKSVGTILYKLKIRDPQHPEQKGFPFEQAITHGIAKEAEGRDGVKYYQYNIETIKNEFEALLETTENKKENQTRVRTSVHTPSSMESKLQQMLQTLNHTLETQNLNDIYRLKADIADIYALLSMQKPNNKAL